MELEPVDITPNLDGGVLKKIIKYGELPSMPSDGSQVTVHYVGKLEDGTVFDSSRDRGEPFKFTLGEGSVIKAWEVGIATMKKGEISLFTCRSDYAYGESGSPPTIPPNATLLFEVEMISWQSEDLSKHKDGSILRTIITVGDGFSSPNKGAVVDVHLVGEYNNKVFEDRDVVFPIGEGSAYGVCKGVEEALLKFKIKEKSRLEIKSHLAFGVEGSKTYDIPPNADVIYTVKLNTFEKLKETWSLDSHEKLEQSKFFKEKGSKYFREQRFSLACKMYKKGTEYLSSDTGFSEEESAERAQLLTALHLNLALSYFKKGNFTESKSYSNKVLDEDANNEKALYRRGMALMEMGNTEEALKDFETIIAFNKQNKSAYDNIVKCKKIIREQRLREKALYSNMFDKFAKHDTEKEEEERKQLPDVMNTLGEWAPDEREREPTNFEKENPNILMLDSTGDFRNM